MSISSKRFLRRSPSKESLPGIKQARYGHWVVNNGAPTEAELQLAASRHLATATFNSDRSEFAARLKALDPGVKILAYVCLSSSRDYEPTQAIAGAVAWNEAVANDWVAKDTTGNRIAWGPYGGHYQTKVWVSGYQDAYISHITSLLSQPLWDGIWADNDFWTLQWYSTQLLAGTTTQAQTDQQIRDGLDTLVSRAGAAAKALNKVLIPNYSEGRSSLQRHAQHAAAGGGICEEQFASWGTGGSPTLYDWGPNSWPDQVQTVRDGEANICVTSIATTDSRTALYAYASFLMRAEPGDGWTTMPANHTAGLMDWQSFQDTTIGKPVGAYMTQGAVWTRRFERAFVAVNPTQTDQPVTLPNTTVVTLTPLTGYIA